MKNNCGCCEGLEKLTPMSTANRPGLDSLIYRVGNHATFLETMLACLSSKTHSELAALTNRNQDDTSIALLDAWATVADVLTFYQERFANEGYLRTAIERRSIMELSRLVGYQLRPGVSASVFLGFTMDTDAIADIPTGTRAQSMPGKDEEPQFFETSDTITAREEWNELQPRLTRPQLITTTNIDTISDIYIEGINNNLEANDPLLFVFGPGSGQQVVRLIAEVETQTDPEDRWKRTRVCLHGADPECRSEPPGNNIDAASRILNTVNKYLDTKTFGVSVTSAMSKRVVKLAKRLQKSVTAESSNSEIFTLLNKILPDLFEESAIAEEGHYGRLEPWIGGLISDLELIEAEMKNIAPAPISRSLVTRAQVINPTGGRKKSNTVLGSLINQGLLTRLSKAPSLPPANAQRLSRSISTIFANKSDTAPRLLSALKPRLKPILYSAIQQTTVTSSVEVKVYVMRTKASLFGHNAPKKLKGYTDSVPKFEEWKIYEGELEDLVYREFNNKLFLDTNYAGVKSGIDSYIIVNRPPQPPIVEFDESIETKIFNDITVNFRSREAYGLSTKTTEVDLKEAIWFDYQTGGRSLTDIDFNVIRSTTVYAENELLTLAEEPILADVTTDEVILAPVKGDQIALTKVYDGFEAGRWIIVSGERFDAPGVIASELLMIASVAQLFDQQIDEIEQEIRGNKLHTVLFFAQDMEFEYLSDSVIIYGNVVKATHGETQTEVLGSGNGSSAFQQFTLGFTPLTHVAAVITNGIDSSLQVRVNDALWQEAVSVFSLDANDREYTTDTNDEVETTIRFGDGKRGLRLPSGIDNISAKYRAGIGKAGNVLKDQISILATRPLGVKEVINPLPATGGADRDTREQARYNTPLAVKALDRLVSVQDFADFARIFAGIGKSNATRLSDGNRQVIYVTIAGIDDIPISENSDLFRSLLTALHQFGDPHQAIQLELREMILLIIHARVRISPEYEWETREPKIRAALLDLFSFERRELGQDAILSEAINVIQGITGVVYVDVDIFDGLVDIEPIEKLINEIECLGEKLGQSSIPKRRVIANLSRLAREEVIENGTNPAPFSCDDNELESENSPKQYVTVLKPAQIAILNPDITDTLILSELR